MSAHPGASFMWLINAQLPVLAIHIWGKKLRGLHGYACGDMRFSPPKQPGYKARWHGVLCSIRTWLWSRWQLGCMLSFVKLFTSKASSCCKYDMDALSWLNSDTLERAPTPLFSGLVRCSAYECSFTRLNSQHTCSGELSLVSVVLYLLLYLGNTHTVYWSRLTYYMYIVQLRCSAWKLTYLKV